MKRQNKILESRFKIWQSLMDTVVYLALAGLKAKGYSNETSWDMLRRHWIKSSQEHKQANLGIAKELYAKRHNNK